ncbi:hypothetical protein HYFRA_00012719 [Hymenoscyphus fraxineus]|uniref:Uncharacterized protein n=1 Tax=Hymenoscyphus fraxineus TaxID=746836 RepID=A0A9N9PUF4_9HELO|nr:hypothetical protein HYFRA_00012719 [Hymenoscyphus fraxineus]
MVIIAGSPQKCCEGVSFADFLVKANFDIIANFEVSRSDIDHHYAVVEYEAKPFVDSYWQLTSNDTREAIESQRYAAHGDGLFGNVVGDTLGMIRLPNDVASEFQKQLPADRPAAGCIHLLCRTLHKWQPETPGSIELASADYRDTLLIYTNY